MIGLKHPCHWRVVTATFSAAFLAALAFRLCFVTFHLPPSAGYATTPRLVMQPFCSMWQARHVLASFAVDSDIIALTGWPSTVGACWFGLQVSPSKQYSESMIRWLSNERRSSHSGRCNNDRKEDYKKVQLMVITSLRLWIDNLAMTSRVEML
jgi:hypothetical protein